MSKEKSLVSEKPYSLKQGIAQHIAAIEAVASALPGVVIIHKLPDLSVVYMSPKGLELLEVDLQEIIRMGPDYHSRFFNAEDSLEYVPKLLGLLEGNNEQESFSFFQQVRGLNQTEWTWYLSSIKILMRNEEGKPLLAITFAVPVNTEHPINSKVARLLDENTFLRQHHHHFARLSKREQEVLKLLGLGKSSNEIARELFISISTADTHRRNIKNKLKASSSFDLHQYARAFNLI
jgi:DNA-binding CsgD family transcriptional regulator